MNGKWVELENTKSTASEAAGEILRYRVACVQQLLPLAAYEYRSDVEHVHRLRVSCRRAGAAWQAFSPLMTGKAKKLRKWLKKIRWAAGPARDADVQLARFKEEKGLAQKYIVQRLKQLRIDAQPALVDIEESAASGRLQRSLDRCLASLENKSSKKGGVSFGMFARSALRQASQKMFQLAGINKPTIDQLHRLRISGKRLRYSIELFHGVFSPALREEVYPLVERIQSRLGQLNDHATAQALLQRWLSDMPADARAAGLAERIVEQYAAMEQAREEFLQWWTVKRIAKLESSLAAMIDETA